MGLTIKDYNPDDQERLQKAWGQIESALEVFKEITGAEFIDDAVHETIWEAASTADKQAEVKEFRQRQ